MVKTDKNKKGKEIPIPQVRIVPTYDQDYLPVYERPGTYVRGKGIFELINSSSFLSNKLQLEQQTMPVTPIASRMIHVVQT